jgi:hypothetical protein
MIVGAGLAGLITAHAIPGHDIIEASPEPRQVHKAVLRFRSTAVSDLIGIPFRPVTVRKGIWDNGWHQPNITAANRYSQKVLGGGIQDRSIWNLDSETRWIAPDNLYERLLDFLWNRIQWGKQANFMGPGETVINTAPLPVVLDFLGIKSGLEFKRAAITVRRYHIPDCDVFQTVYYPSPEHSMYRASITGSLLICEFAGEPRGDWAAAVLESFGIPGAILEELEEVTQDYGKISPVDDNLRRALLGKLTQKYDIFSVGRFATWRNILLDDVVHDIAVVKSLMNATEYERQLWLAGGERK